MQVNAHVQLILAEFGRDRGRTVLTWASIVTAFFLLGLLGSVRDSFLVAGQSAYGAKRLITSARASLTQTLPVALKDKIAALDGVIGLAYASWFAGYYQGQQQPLAAYAVSDDYFTVYPEIDIDPWAQQDFKATRNAILVGENIAHQFGWSVGQSIPLLSGVFYDRAGNPHWEFVVAGILRANDANNAGVYANMLLLRWDFVSERSAYFDGQVGWYISAVGDPSQSDRVAHLIDALSLNSDHETRTMSENAAFAAQIQQWADVGLIARAIMAAVLFSLLFLTVSVIAQSVRERRGELALLQALGFSLLRIGALVVGETTLLLLAGGLAGLVLACAGALAVDHFSGGMLKLSAFNLESLGMAVVLMLGFGLVAGLIPVVVHAKSRAAQTLLQR